MNTKTYYIVASASDSLELCASREIAELTADLKNLKYPATARVAPFIAISVQLPTVKADVPMEQAA